MYDEGSWKRNERCGKMLQYFLPNEYVKSVLDITPDELKQKGIKGIITDLDNTLVEWDRPAATPQLIKWFAEMKKHGIQIVIVSNNNENRVRTFAAPLEIPFIFAARKPMVRAFRQALQEMNLKKEEAVVIGDQLLTDILGGNRLGMHTILVVPVAQTDGFWTRFNRKIERKLLEMMKRKGMVYWEE
jgi:uncharacterized protein